MRSLAFDIPTGEGVFLIRDVAADTPEAQRPAARAMRIPGHRGGKMVAAVGAVLRVRCAHQYSSPHLTLQILDREPADEPGWEWATITTLDLPTGRIQVDCGEEPAPPPLLDIDAGAGPGRCAVTLGHQGRADMLARALQVGTETMYADADTTRAAWQEAGRLERYLVRIWPQERHRRSATLPRT
ncbi:hypothetical protein ACQP2P_28025 [Dactylosporangium sp. CA-139114]|uniref:hypothetical protein n=1 Tax=Dactylosporangium sp. CA-139114 TaxID=3239931 RepID=UPI003D96FE3D